MPPTVKVNKISETIDDDVSYDAIVEAINADQEPQLLDSYDSSAPRDAPDDVSQDARVNKARPKRSPKKKAVTIGEASPLRYIDQINAIECCIPTAKEEQPKEDEEQPKEDDLLGCNPSEHGVRHEEQPKEEEPKEEEPKEDEQPKKNAKIVELKECENAVRNLQLERLSIHMLQYAQQTKIHHLLKVVRKKLLHLTRLGLAQARMVYAMKNLNNHKLLDLERGKNNLISCLLMQFNILYLIIWTTLNYTSLLSITLH